MQVRFFAGIKAQYLGLTKHNPKALYFCADTNELFWGDRCISDGTRVVPTFEDLPQLAEAADGIIYYVADTHNGYVLSADRTMWTQVIYANSSTDLSEYYTKPETDSAIEAAVARIELPDVSGFIKDIPPEYITETELEAKGYLTEHQDISNKADLSHRHDDIYDPKGAAEAVKNDILNGAGAAYDTLKELGELIVDNKDAIEALEAIATGKADKDHTHTEYLTEHQSLEAYAKKVDIPEVDKFITIQDVEAKNYLTAVPDEYITNSELEAKKYLTEHQSLDHLAIKDHAHENYANKDHVHEQYLTEHQDISGKAEKEHTHSYTELTNRPEIPSIDGLATEQFVNNAVVAKANEIPFVTNKYVQKAIGNFVIGDNVNGMTLAEILAKLLGLSDEADTPDQPDIPEEPTSIVDNIMSNKIPMYQIDDNDNIVEVAYNFNSYTETEAATINDNKSCFYTVSDTDGNRIEAGYQHFSTAKEPYYIVALPEYLEVTADGNVLLQTWDQDNKKWVDAHYVLTSNYDEIVTTYDADGITPPVAPDGYKLWADLSTNDPGTSYRFIIKE